MLHIKDNVMHGPCLTSTDDAAGLANFAFTLSPREFFSLYLQCILPVCKTQIYKPLVIFLIILAPVHRRS